MTLVYTRRHMHQLISEIKNEWVVDNPNDPDLRSIADVLPLDVLEAAYIAKLDALPGEPLPEHAQTARQKLLVMRRIFAAWCRTREELGPFLSTAFGGSESDQFLAENLVFSDDAKLVTDMEKRYPRP